jgi:hypothetical protein
MIRFCFCLCKMRRVDGFDKSVDQERDGTCRLFTRLVTLAMSNEQ